MKPSKFAALATLAALTLATSGATPAETAEGEYVFTAVDSVEAYSGSSFSGGTVVGVLEGQSTPQSVSYGFSSPVNPCERMALMAMQKPGRYLFTIKDPESFSRSCRLTRH
jgi:hypothetical protein